MKYQRELTAAVLIPVVLLLLVAGPAWAFALLVLLATGAALWEFQAMLEASGWVVSRATGLALLASFLTAALLGSLAALVALVAATLVLVPTLVLFAAPRTPVWLQSSAAGAFATLYVAAGGAAVVGLRGMGFRPVLFLLAIVWAGDSAAYYSGRRFGKRRLAPVVSPKKSWEGFWGQVAAGAVVGGPLAWALLAGRASVPFLLAGGAVAGVLVSLSAVVGDLVESTFKRSCAIKDSGGLLPGHGGLLDRLDSLLYTAPVLYGALCLVPGLSLS